MIVGLGNGIHITKQSYKYRWEILKKTNFASITLRETNFNL